MNSIIWLNKTSSTTWQWKNRNSYIKIGLLNHMNLIFNWVTYYKNHMIWAISCRHMKLVRAPWWEISLTSGSKLKYLLNLRLMIIKFKSIMDYFNFPRWIEKFLKSTKWPWIIIWWITEYSCWKYFGSEGAYFGNLNGSTSDWTYSWTKPMHDSHFKIVPDIQRTIFRLFFVNSHTIFRFKSLFFWSRILFSSVSSSVLQTNSSNMSSRNLQDLQNFFFCIKSLYTDNHSVSSSPFLPLAINSFPGIIQITIISWSFFSLNREEELFVDPS